jgi:hypothetical protein
LKKKLVVELIVLGLSKSLPGNRSKGSRQDKEQRHHSHERQVEAQLFRSAQYHFVVLNRNAIVSDIRLKTLAAYTACVKAAVLSTKVASSIASTALRYA